MQYSKSHYLCIILLPLGLMAIVSYSLDSQAPLYIPDALQVPLLEISRVIIPGIFTLLAACMVPTASRMLQLIIVTVSYFVIAEICNSYFPGIFSQPTPWIIAALSSTAVLMPNQDELGYRKVSWIKTAAKSLGALLLPFASLLAMYVIGRNIHQLISFAFTDLFVKSPLSCIILPVFTVMQSIGFNSLLCQLPLQNSTWTLQVFINIIILSNMFSLPAAILTRALLSSSKLRPFLVFLGLMALLTSGIGSCVSITLLILLLFFPGTFLSLLISSMLLFFLLFNQQIGNFTGFITLYNPDLILNESELAQLGSRHFFCILIAIILPCIIQTIVYKVKNVYYQNRSRILTQSDGLRRVSFKSSPDLCVIALLKAIGGKDNLAKAWFSPKTGLLIQVRNAGEVKMAYLKLICKRKPLFMRKENIYDLGSAANTRIVYLRLRRMLNDDDDFEYQDISLSKEFIISSADKQL